MNFKVSNDFKKFFNNNKLSQVDLDQGLLQTAQVCLYRELEQKKLFQFKPQLFYGDEWFTPDGTIWIAVPFYLGSVICKKIEKELIGEVEGGSFSQMMKLIRHEAGHCFEHAYRLSKTKEWKSFFGNPSDHYDPEFFYPDPTNLSYVSYLPDFYSQSHPEEDFAETFAFWLDPKKNTKIKNFALKKKFDYLDEISKKLSKVEPFPKYKKKAYEVSTLKYSIKKHYQMRFNENPCEFFFFYDDLLFEFFESKPGISGAEWIKERSVHLVSRVQKNTSVHPYFIKKFLKKCMKRCEFLKLSVSSSCEEIEKKLIYELSILFLHYRIRGRMMNPVKGTFV